jgi:glycosyltransferase involved in cell wall biosynthesis
MPRLGKGYEEINRKGYLTLHLKVMIRIASVVFSYYPADPRPRREAEALVEAGMSVDVICLRGDGEQHEEQVNGVNVVRLPVIRTRKGKLNYLWEYGSFILLASYKLSMLYIMKRYHAVHVHNMPDVLVFSALLPRLGGAKIILDLHDPMPEVYMTKYFIPGSHPAIWVLRILENLSIKFANVVVTPNTAFRNLFISRGCADRKIHIVMNSPQENIFKADSNNVSGIHKKDFIIMYHGAIMERNGLDTALSAILAIKKEIPNLKFEVYGDGDFVNQFLKLVRELSLKSTVHFYGYRPLEVIAEVIRKIDVGIIPNKMSPFTNLNLPTRIFEYLSIAKPVIAPRTKGILDYFDSDSLYFFKPGDPQSLAERIIDVYQNVAQRQEILNRGMKVYQACRWDLQKRDFIEVVRNLVGMNG